MATSRTPPDGPSRPVVLFVDDNLTQLDLYSMVLEDDFDVLTESRGETGFELASTSHPDVIVLDLLLPDANGLDVADRLRANPATASIPIIILTANDAEFARAQTVRPPFSDVLMKPCPADRLHAAIRRALAVV